MKSKLIILGLCLFCLGAMPIGETKSYFADLEVIETVSRRKLEVHEVMELIDRLPNVKRVSLKIDPPRKFIIRHLAYPQYAADYTLTKSEWAELQALCADGLKRGNAAEEVLAHWLSIVQGTPPFGLRIAK
jgi:hypothetical protein